jgi:hypothetical protein
MENNKQILDNMTNDELNAYYNLQFKTMIAEPKKCEGKLKCVQDSYKEMKKEQQKLPRKKYLMNRIKGYYYL